MKPSTFLTETTGKYSRQTKQVQRRARGNFLGVKEMFYVLLMRWFHAYVKFLETH